MILTVLDGILVSAFFYFGLADRSKVNHFQEPVVVPFYGGFPLNITLSQVNTHESACYGNRLCQTKHQRCIYYAGQAGKIREQDKEGWVTNFLLSFIEFMEKCHTTTDKEWPTKTNFC